MHEDRVAKALEYAEAGQIDGDHHKLWVIDQMVRALTGCPMVEKEKNGYKYEVQGESEEYLRWVFDYSHDDEGNTYSWNVGIAP